MSNWQSTPTVRWPFKVSGNFVLKNTSGASSSTQTMPYQYMALNNGGAVVDGFRDFVDEVQSMLTTAYNSIFTSGASFVVSLTAEGRLAVLNASPNDLLVDYNASSADLANTLGALTTEDTTLAAGQTTTLPYHCGGVWWPGIEAELDTPEYQRSQTRQVGLVGGSFARHSHSLDPHYRRIVKWQVVAAARVIDDRAQDQNYCDVAGMTAGDPATVERLSRYLRDPSSATNPLPMQVYLFDLAESHSGPYQVDLEKSDIIEGVADKHLVADMNSEHYTFQLHLHRDADS